MRASLPQLSRRTLRLGTAALAATLPLATLNDYGETILAQRISMVDGVAQVQVFGDVGEVGKITEGTHHRNGRFAPQAVEHGLELLAHRLVAVAPEAHRVLADGLDNLVHFFALLRAQGVAEHAPEQADVLLERQVLVARAHLRLFKACSASPMRASMLDR